MYSSTKVAPTDNYYKKRSGVLVSSATMTQKTMDTASESKQLNLPVISKVNS